MPKSDIDILVSDHNFDLMKKSIIENFGNHPNFLCNEILVQDEKTILASFTHQGKDFEIFGQQTPSVKQRGYLHFLAEVGLLKLSGPLIMEKFKEARKQGLKTEEAFAKVLKLNGDPYEELLAVQKMSNDALKTLLAKSVIE